MLCLHKIEIHRLYSMFKPFQNSVEKYVSYKMAVIFQLFIFTIAVLVCRTESASDCLVDFQNDTCDVASVPKLDFCSMVNYPTVGNKTLQIQRDHCAHNHFVQMKKVLNTYDCSRSYGYHDCSACRDAYKYWLCSYMFPKCGKSSSKTAGKPCLSVCQDVIRKCPYVLEFNCPASSWTGISHYSLDDSTCNKLDRTFLVDGKDEVFPAYFN